VTPKPLQTPRRFPVSAKDPLWSIVYRNFKFLDQGSRILAYSAPMKELEPLITEAEATAQAELQEMAGDVEAICARLMALKERLPVPPTEGLMLLGEEEMDVSTEVRAVIECVLNDSLRPAIRDLETAAAYRPPRKRG
jgi:hypothetical protein